MKKLSTAFPGSFGSAEKAKDVGLLWRDLLDQHPWISPAVFERGVYHIAWEHPGEYLPPPARALEFFDLARQELRREADARRPRLPVPEAPTERERLEADARAEAAKGAARALLPPRMRARSPKRREGAR